MRGFVVVFALLGGAAVVLGALGAHALAEELAGAGRDVAWQTAVSYLFWHVLAGMAAVSLGEQWCTPRSLKTVCALWIAGILLFSGSIFALCLGAPGWLGPLTPLGGLVLIGGWLVLAVACLMKPKH